MTGKNIIVTGASSGIGQRIALVLGQAGATVAVHAFRHKNEALKVAEQCGHDSDVFIADLENTRECLDLFDSAVTRYGRIHALINNAGIFQDAPISLADMEWRLRWDRTLAINLTAAGLLTKAALPHFSKHGGGTFVFISSRAAFRGETGDYLAYAASKGGMVSLSRSIARSFGKENIVSFTIAPGFVRTPMTEAYMEKTGEESILGELSLNRLTEPDDIASMVLFLCSGKLDQYTGSLFDANGGSYIH